MKRIGILLTAAICVVSLVGCSSPYLPHNAVKYIPEFYEQGESQRDETTRQGGISMKAESSKHPQSYFSPDSIRERYAQHIQRVSADDCDLLIDIAWTTVQLMRRDGKSEEAIRAELKDKFHFSDEVIDTLVKE